MMGTIRASLGFFSSVASVRCVAFVCFRNSLGPFIARDTRGMAHTQQMAKENARDNNLFATVCTIWFIVPNATEPFVYMRVSCVAFRVCAHDVCVSLPSPLSLSHSSQFCLLFSMYMSLSLSRPLPWLGASVSFALCVRALFFCLTQYSQRAYRISVYFPLNVLCAQASSMVLTRQSNLMHTRAARSRPVTKITKYSK